MLKKITATNKRQFNKLIKEYRENGFFLITLGNKLAELEKGNEMVVIEL